MLTQRNWRSGITAVTARVQVFARAPVSGEVKTRLIPRLGADAAARLQTTLTRHALTTAIDARVGPVELWCSPDCSHPTFTAFAHHGVVLFDQGSGDLGERMHRALSHALLVSDVSILIGSDCPSLTPQDLRAAVRALQRGADFAFTPAEDGGYVLVAARTCSPSVLRRVFDDVTWGTSSVMEQTRSRLRELGQTWKELATRWDIDRPEDYERLLREQPRAFAAEP